MPAGLPPELLGGKPSRPGTPRPSEPPRKGGLLLTLGLIGVLGVTAADCVIVGDRLDTDIVMGKHLGLATVLVLSGVTRPGDPRIAELRPDLVLPSVQALLR